MPVYPLTSSQQTKATKDQLISFLKSPAQVSRRLGEILAAQEFLSFFLLTMQGLEIKGGAIAIPRGEPLRTDRPARDVAPGAEYPLTTMSREQYEVYTALKKGLSTEVTDEEIGRSARQPIDDAMTFLKTEHIFTQDDVAMAMVKSSVTAELTATSNWTTGKILWKDAERARMKLRQMRLGFEVNTAVLPSDLYTEVLPSSSRSWARIPVSPPPETSPTSAASLGSRISPEPSRLRSSPTGSASAASPRRTFLPGLCQGRQWHPCRDHDVP